MGKERESRDARANRKRMPRADRDVAAAEVRASVCVCVCVCVLVGAQAAAAAAEVGGGLGEARLRPRPSPPPLSRAPLRSRLPSSPSSAHPAPAHPPAPTDGRTDGRRCTAAARLPRLPLLPLPRARPPRPGQVRRRRRGGGARRRGGGGEGRGASLRAPAGGRRGLRKHWAVVRVAEVGSPACGAGRRGWSLPSRLKMAPPIFPLPLIPVPGREPRGRGGGGDGGGGGRGWRGWARDCGEKERAGILPCLRALLQ